jgi:hypothetical protein
VSTRGSVVARGQDRYLYATPFLPICTATDLKRFQSELILRLRGAEHVVLYGPLGGGKSTLLAEVYARIAASGTPCGLSVGTATLDDITRTFTHAYPEVNTATTRRKARGRLLAAADQRPGVLIFDHVTRVSTAMIGYLRRLRGGIAGVVLAFDIEKESERLRLRDRHLGRPFLPMPLASNKRMHRLLGQCCAAHRLPRIAPHHERQIVHAARGRIGWIAQCARLIVQGRYGSGATLRVAVLCIDTEIALRQGEVKLHSLETQSA